MLKIKPLTSQQSAEEKAFQMAAFVEGRAQILVSTTVIEVGVDVPNASVADCSGQDQGCRDV